MGDKVFNHLEKLDAPKGYGSFYVGSALPRELGYLENLGYLDDFLRRFDRQNVDNLSDWVELTEAGRLFLELRNSARKKKRPLDHPAGSAR